MANEAVCYEPPTRFARYTVSSTAVIPKGSILAITTPETAAICSADDDVFGGIAMMEKTATNDNTTEISAALNGVWGLVAGSAAPITIGQDVSISGVNEIKVYTSLDDEKGFIVGKILEGCGSAAPTRVKVRVNV